VAVSDPAEALEFLRDNLGVLSALVTDYDMPLKRQSRHLDLGAAYRAEAESLDCGLWKALTLSGHDPPHFPGSTWRLMPGADKGYDAGGFVSSHETQCTAQSLDVFRF
jgi:hypothetical protein